MTGSNTPDSCRSEQLLRCLLVRPELPLEIRLGNDGRNGVVTGRRPGNPIERQLSYSPSDRCHPERPFASSLPKARKVTKADRIPAVPQVLGSLGQGLDYLA